jgi:hypothetical protein
MMQVVAAVTLFNAIQTRRREVNEFSLDIGDEGRGAIGRLVDRRDVPS